MRNFNQKKIPLHEYNAMPKERHPARLFPEQYIIFPFTDVGAKLLKPSILPNFIDVKLAFNGKLLGYAKISDSSIFKSTKYYKCYDLFISRYLLYKAGQTQLTINGMYAIITPNLDLKPDKLSIILSHKRPSGFNKGSLIHQTYSDTQAFNDSFFS